MASIVRRMTSRDRMMKRHKLIEPKKIVAEEVEIPKPSSGQSLIEVKACGICGTDIHAYHGKHPFISTPIVLGHEFSGVQTETGAHVVVEPSLVCGKCYNCRTGRYNICNALKVIGCQSDGAFAEYIAVPMNKVFRIPEEMNFEEAALVEPAAVGVHAARQAGVRQKDRIVIFGAGPIGLMTLQASRALGAGEVTVADFSKVRLELAKQLGADYVVDVAEADLVKWVQKNFGPDGIDKVFECVGGSQQTTLKQAIELTRKGTRITVVGVFPGSIPVEMSLLQDREIELVGSLMYRGEDFPTAINLIHRGKIDAKRLISKVFPMDKVSDAFELLEREREGIIKIVLKQ